MRRYDVECVEEPFAAPVIVVGVDGSEGSDRALEWCRDHAPKMGASIVAVHAFSPYYGFPALDMPGAVIDVEGWRKEVQRALETEWTAALGDTPHRVVLVEGAAAHAILDVAEREGADLVVVGSRGRSSVAELFLGSVSHHLVHRASRPVLVVPPERR